MNKAILITLLCAFITSAQAQFNREDILGKWTGIGIKTEALVLSQDDIEGSLQTFINAALEKDSSKVITAADSAQFLIGLAEVIGGLNKCYIQFDKNGKVKALLEFGEKNGKTIKGTWKWIDSDKVQIDGESGYLLVVKLTSDRLSIIPIADPDKKDAERIELQFSKGK